MKKHCLFFSLVFMSLQLNAQNFDVAGQRKVNAIEKVVKLNDNQRGIIKSAYQTFLSVQDSAMNKVADTERSFQIIYDAKHEFHNRLMDILTTPQIVAYVKQTGSKCKSKLLLYFT